MKKQRISGVMLFFIALVLLGVTACNTYQPYVYQDNRELLPGPGLFSGEDGEFTILRILDKKAATDPAALSQQPDETEVIEKVTPKKPDSGR